MIKEECKNRPRIIRLITATAGRFLDGFYSVCIEVGQPKVNDNEVMCHLPMKLFDMFDQTLPHTGGKTYSNVLVFQSSKDIHV